MDKRPWLTTEAGWPEQVPREYDFPRITLYEMLSRSADLHGEMPAVWFLNTFMTYRELLAHVDALAAGLHAMGLKKGEVVALLLPSCFQYVISYYACAKLGVIVTGVNPTYKPGEVLHQLKLTGARAIIILDALYESLLAPTAGVHDIDHVVATSVVDMVKLSPFKKWLGKTLKKIPTGPVPADAIDYLELMSSSGEYVAPEVSSDDIATYIMTGGTTGVPKAAILTHFNCVSNAIQVGLWVWVKDPGACMVGVLPLFHSFGMSAVMNAALHSGMWMMLFPKPPDTTDLVKTICRVAPDNQTYYPGAEVLFQNIAGIKDIEKYPLNTKLRGCISGAGPLHRHVKTEFEQVTNAILLEGYGLSEASPVVSAGPLSDVDTTGTIGIPLTGIEWRIVDMETGEREVQQGESGELVVTGPTVMAGYLNDPDETAVTVREINSKKWLYTGDIGFMDAHGRVTLNDRKKLLIKVKGYSVFPTEVEQFMVQNQSIYEVAVAGLPDEETGEAIKAWVTLKETDKGRITEDQLKAWCRENITHYKVPKYIEFIDEIPKTLVGKVMRRELQESDPIYLAYYGQEKRG